MIDFDTLLKEAKDDVRIAIEVWTDILQELLGKKLRKAFAKGSALKNWDTPIDYVPQLSDVDIHILLTDGINLFDDSAHAFNKAIKISREYEKLFFERNKKPLHLPRTQIVVLNKLLEDPSYVPPRSKDVHMMIGEPLEISFVSKEVIREIDRQHLLELEPFVETLPLSVIDRSSLDYWTFLRRINWRVSPCPVRLLTQISEDPLDIWSWNRTRIIHELNRHGYSDIADYYQAFYQEGWQLFLSQMQNTEIYRNILLNGYYVLKGSIKAIQKI